MFSFLAYLLGGVWIAENWKTIVAVLAALILLIVISRRSKKKRAAQYAQAVRQQEEERQRKQAQPAASSPRPAAPVQSPAPSKAPTPPEEIDGKQQVYHYSDVRFSPFNASAAYRLTGKKVTFSRKDDKIGVYVEGTLLGVMENGRLRDMVSDWLENDDPIFAVLSHVDASGAAFFDLAFYRSEMERLLYRHQDAKMYKLTGNKSDDYQASLSLCSVGEECSVEYDYDKEKYSVSTSYADLGFLPAAAARIIDDSADQDARVFVADLEEDGEGRTVVSVYVFVD